MNDLLQGLTNKQIKFIVAECNINADDIESLDEDSINRIYECICDIEVEETINAGDNELSERGKTAEKIVTMVGNKIKEINDYPDE